jgi:hypothetical protein
MTNKFQFKIWDDEKLEFIKDDCEDLAISLKGDIVGISDVNRNTTLLCDKRYRLMLVMELYND